MHAKAGSSRNRSQSFRARWNAPIAALAALLVPTLTAQAGGVVLYTVEDLGSLSGPVNEAYDIAPDGRAVGRVLDPSLVPKAVFFAPGSVVNLGGPAFSNSEARGISSNGLIAGFLGNTGILWQDLAPTVLNALPGHIASRGQDVNAAGLVVGWSVNSVGDPTAATWQGGVLTPLDVNHSWAFRVNDAGQIIGRRDIATGREARLWHDGTGVTLPDLGANSASATHITPRGVIVGGACQPVAPGECGPREVIWVGVDHEIQILPTLPGALLQNVWTANDRGLILGESSADLGGNGLVALMYRWPDLQPLDLNDFISSTSGWTLESAQAVNHDGSFVGYGVYQGLPGRRAFLAHPIEPADITYDALVDFQDLQALFAAWGPCIAATPCPADLTGDGRVGVLDLLEILDRLGVTAREHPSGGLPPLSAQ